MALTVPLMDKDNKKDMLNMRCAHRMKTEKQGNCFIAISLRLLGLGKNRKFSYSLNRNLNIKIVIYKFSRPF